jgi:hypothetical protein
MHISIPLAVGYIRIALSGFRVQIMDREGKVDEVKRRKLHERVTSR